MENSGYAVRAETDDHFCDVHHFMFHEEICPFILKYPEVANRNFNHIRDKSFECYILYDKSNEKIGFGLVKKFESIKKACIDVGAPESCRGKDLVFAARDGLRQIVERNPGIEIYSYINNKNRKALHFNWMCGFKIHKTVFGHKILRYKNV